MSLKITAIRAVGDLDKERIVMRATLETDIGEYVLLKTGYNEETSRVTTRVYAAFWFPNKKIKAGDFAVVYTKRGKSSSKEFGDHTSHFFYWGETKSHWDHASCSAVLLNAPTWQSFRPEEE